jgi:hypothetical protein
MPDEQTPKPFDLVELTEPADGFEIGSRGTVVLQGIGQAHVDFNWCDEGPGGYGHRHCGVIPHRCMRVVRPQTFDAAFSARRMAAPLTR